VTAPERLPRYRELPTRDGVDHCAWGLFGEADQVGMFNLQTPERVTKAARLVRQGKVFPLNWKLEMPSPPVYGRGALKHSIVSFPPDDWGHDDWYDNFYPQASSQWDGLTHVGIGGGLFYNGVRKDQVTGAPGTRNGIEHWAERGIAGRCVLLDYARWHERERGPLLRNETHLISVDDLEGVRRAQGVALEAGDVLLIRTGWMEWYEQQDEATRVAVSQPGATRFPGLDSTEEMAAYLWDHGLCAVAADNPAVEARPSRNAGDGRIFLHYYLLGRFGMAIGEMFYLERLAAECAADGTYEAFFTSAPLNKLGGAGSPPNALAIK
jgi:kynurenine formamidase